MMILLLVFLAWLNFDDALDQIRQTTWSDANTEIIWLHFTTNIRLFTLPIVCCVLAFLCFCHLRDGKANASEAIAGMTPPETMRRPSE